MGVKPISPISVLLAPCGSHPPMEASSPKRMRTDRESVDQRSFLRFHLASTRAIDASLPPPTAKPRRTGSNHAELLAKGVATAAALAKAPDRNIAEPTN